MTFDLNVKTVYSGRLLPMSSRCIAHASVLIALVTKVLGTGNCDIGALKNQLHCASLFQLVMKERRYQTCKYQGSQMRLHGQVMGPLINCR